MKTTITKAERLQLIGLHAVSEHLNAQLRALEEAAHAVLGIEDGDAVGPHKSDPKDHVSDLLYGGTETVSTILKNLGVKVKP